jgi:hypothetical protein
MPGIKECRKQSVVRQSQGVCISMGTATSTLCSLLSVYVALFNLPDSQEIVKLMVSHIQNLRFPTIAHW